MGGPKLLIVAPMSGHYAPDIASKSARGVAGSVEVSYPPPGLAAKPVRDPDAPMLVRVTPLDDDRFRIEYLGLIDAAAAGDIPALRALLETSDLDLNIRDAHGRTALMAATYTNPDHAVIMLSHHFDKPVFRYGYNGGDTKTRNFER